jgi:hypothetical protein
MNGENTFPMFSNDGNICARYCSMLIKDKPEVLDGGSFGMSEEVQGDKGGSWIVIKFDHNENQTAIAKKVADAEKMLDDARAEV